MEVKMANLTNQLLFGWVYSRMNCFFNKMKMKSETKYRNSFLSISNPHS